MTLQTFLDSQCGLERDEDLDAFLLSEHEAKDANALYQEMLFTRRQLPSYDKKHVSIFFNFVHPCEALYLDIISFLS